MNTERQNVLALKKELYSITRERADAVAEGDQGRIRDIVVGEAQPCDNQSAERRGEEQTARDVRI